MSNDEPTNILLRRYEEMAAKLADCQAAEASKASYGKQE